jgi:hypothetical protein
VVVGLSGVFEHRTFRFMSLRFVVVLFSRFPYRSAVWHRICSSHLFHFGHDRSCECLIAHRHSGTFFWLGYGYDHDGYDSASFVYTLRLASFAHVVLSTISALVSLFYVFSVSPSFYISVHRPSAMYHQCVTYALPNDQRRM